MKTDHECLIIVGSGQGGYTSSEGGRGRRMVTGPPFNKSLECSFEAVFFLNDDYVWVECSQKALPCCCDMVCTGESDAAGEPQWWM